VNAVDRVRLLLKAEPSVRFYRDAGISFEEIALKCPKTCNPLSLSPRQLRRVYEGDLRFRFDIIRRLVIAQERASKLR
jgi:hypothetical protein